MEKQIKLHPNLLFFSLVKIKGYNQCINRIFKDNNKNFKLLDFNNRLIQKNKIFLV